MEFYGEEIYLLPSNEWYVLTPLTLLGLNYILNVIIKYITSLRQATQYHKLINYDNINGNLKIPKGVLKMHANVDTISLLNIAFFAPF